MQYRESITYRLFSALLSMVLVVSFAIPVQAQSVLNLPQPGTMVVTSPSFTPPNLIGITIYPKNPLQFDFIVDTGDDDLQGEALHKESEKLIKYFMTTLTIPEKEMWVNLSPYEKNRIIANGLGGTQMGIDMLAQDYILKQLTASLMYPEDRIGSEFWKRVYNKAQAKYGTTEIPMNTFNKIWIVPEKASVYINGNSVFIADSHLKVMLEEDYLALESNLGNTEHGVGELPEDKVFEISGVTSEIVRDILIPEIEKEVNEGKNFATLRQIFHSMILASWYKRNLRESVLGQIYVDKNKIDGVDIEDKESKQKVYAQYLEAFEKGVYDFIKEDYDVATQEVIPRKYFSGGEDFAQLADKVSEVEGRPALGRDNGNYVIAKGRVDPISPSSPSSPGISDQAALSSESSSKPKASSPVLRKVRKGFYALSLSTVIIVGGAYSYMRWGYDISTEHLFIAPNPSQKIDWDKKTLTFSGQVLDLEYLTYWQGRIKSKVDQQTADQVFWRNVFASFPENMPVSALVTPELLQKTFETSQLDDLFNALRTNPNLLYRYLSEIPNEQMDRFSRYFATLKPGIRQQIFEIFYGRLRGDVYVFENSLIFIEKNALQEQNNRMQRLYAMMVQMTNRVKPVMGEDFREGSLVIETLPGDLIASLPVVSMSRQQSLDYLSNMFRTTLEKYRGMGYKIILPNKDRVNASDVAGLISYNAKISYQSDGSSIFLADNKAGSLLQWVEEQTDSHSTRAHRVTDAEILDKTMQLYINDSTQTIDLFKVIATIGHYYKVMARQAIGTIGGYEARAFEDGTDYIWNRHDHSAWIWAVDQEGEFSVDDQGRPVMFWRPVDEDGNHSIPEGQRTGILRPATGDEIYHAWNTILMSYYVSAKSLEEIKIDWAAHFNDGPAMFRTNPETGKLERVEVDTEEAIKQFSFWSLFWDILRGHELHAIDIRWLPMMYKHAQLAGIDGFAWEFDPLHFGQKSGNKSEERIKSVYAEFGSDSLPGMIAEGLVSVEDYDGVDLLENVNKKTVEGGISSDRYYQELTERWIALGDNINVDNFEEAWRILLGFQQFVDLRDDLFWHDVQAPPITLKEFIIKASESNPEVYQLILRYWDGLPEHVRMNLEIEVTPEGVVSGNSRTGYNTNSDSTATQNDDSAEVGGIDLNPEMLEFQTQGGRIQYDIPLDVRNLDSIPINGFSPVIYQIIPVNLQMLIGASDDESQQQLSLAQ